MGVITQRVAARSNGLARSNAALPFQQWVDYFKFNGSSYPFMPQTTMPANKQEEPAPTFEGFLRQVYKENGVIFACMTARMFVFSQARFQFRRFNKGRPGELFGDKTLGILEEPWQKATTKQLLSRNIQDADLAGNAFTVRLDDGLQVMRPDWVDIIVGSTKDATLDAWDVRARLVGYAYWPGGRGSGREVEIFLPNEVAHFAPLPDPQFRFRGMSWITPIIRTVMSDQAATDHKLSFFEHAATPNMVVKFPKDSGMDEKKLSDFVKKVDERHAGIDNAWRTLYLTAGADVEVVGKDMKEMDFKLTQGAGETRIASAAGVPPIMVGLSEGLEAATYSNYGQARRAFSDITVRSLWQDIAASMQPLLPRRADSAKLWYDDRDISFLQEDMKDQAAIMQIQSSAYLNFINAGADPDSVAATLLASDIGQLKHSGLYSVQLQPPGTTFEPSKAPDQPPLPGEPEKPALPPGEKPKTKPKAKPEASLPPVLTDRERTVARGVVDGRSNKEIAHRLGLSVRTIESHVANAIAKTGTGSRTQLAKWVSTNT